MGQKKVFLFIVLMDTWAQQPYIAVLKSVHRTANLGSFMDTFRTFCLTVRILHHTKLQTVAVLWTLFGVVEIPSQNCKPWQFYGHFSEFLKKCPYNMDTSSRFFSEVLK